MRSALVTGVIKTRQNQVQVQEEGMSKFYRIRVGGHLDSGWSEWFEGLRLTHEANGETVLSGPIVDEAALHGVLAKVRDLGLPLLAVNRVEPGLEQGS